MSLIIETISKPSAYCEGLYLKIAIITLFALIGFLFSCNEVSEDDRRDIGEYTLVYEKSLVLKGEEMEIAIVTSTIPGDLTPTYTLDPRPGFSIDKTSGTIRVQTTAEAAIHTLSVTASADGDDPKCRGSLRHEVAVGVTEIVAEELAKAVAEEDRRYHYVVFTLKSFDDSDLGLYKFGLMEYWQLPLRHYWMIRWPPEPSSGTSTRIG